MKSFINCKDCKYFLPYDSRWLLKSDGKCRFLVRGGMSYQYTGRRRNDGCRYGKKKLTKKQLKVNKKGCKSLQKEAQNG